MLQGGFVGVDIFFVISGFLISGIIFSGLAKGTFSFADFYKRRIRRIFPALLLVLTACYGFAWFALFPEEFRQLSKHIVGGAVFISNFLLRNEAGYFDNLADTKPLLHLWSLGIEEQFYIVWPLLVYCIWKYRSNLLPVISLLLLSSFLYNAGRIHIAPIDTFYSPLTRFWELLAGSLLAYINSYPKSRSVSWAVSVAATCQRLLPQVSNRDAMSVLGSILILAALALLDKDKLFPGMWALLPVLGAGLILAAGPDAWINRKILSHPLLVWIGMISYPLYLWHWPLLSFARIVLSETPSIGIRTTLVLLSIALAWATYILVEKPLRFGDYGNRKVLALGMFMATAGVVGLTTQQLDGLPSRTSISAYHNNKLQLVRTPERDEACLALIHSSGPLFPYCRLNHPPGASETVALIGDSHAHAAFPGLAEMLAEKHAGLLLLANSSCPPLLGAVTGDNARQRADCAARIEALMTTLLKQKDIRTVIISTRAPIYISGNGFGEAEKDYRNREIQPWPPMASDASSLQLFGDSLQRTVNTLTTAGKKVYFILENPEIGVDPAACLPRVLRSETSPHCNIALQTVLERQASSRTLLQSLQHLTIIDPLPAFCVQGVCRVFDDKQNLLYTDNNHLSVAGSRFQAYFSINKYLKH